MSVLPFHSLANIFPLLGEDQLMELAKDIRDNGLREPIVLYEGAILDGRNRYRACKIAGIEPRFEEFVGDNPAAYVASLNLKRRHLDAAQRAMIAARLANLQHGGDRSKAPAGALTQARAAHLLNVGKRSVERARKVLDKGSPELIAAVKQGDMSLSAAAKAVSPIAK